MKIKITLSHEEVGLLAAGSRLLVKILESSYGIGPNEEVVKNANKARDLITKKMIEVADDCICED